MIEDHNSTAPLMHHKVYKHHVIDELLEKEENNQFLRVITRKGTHSKVYEPDFVLLAEFLRILSCYPGRSDRFGVKQFLNSVLRKELPDVLEKITKKCLGDAKDIPVGWRYLIGEMRLGSYSDMDLSRVPQHLRIMLAQIILLSCLIQYLGERLALIMLPFDDFSQQPKRIAEKKYGKRSEQLEKFDDSFQSSWKGFKGTCGEAYKIMNELAPDGDDDEKNDIYKRTARMLNVVSRRTGVSRNLLQSALPQVVDKLYAIILWVLEVDNDGDHRPKMNYDNWFASNDAGSFPFEEAFRADTDPLRSKE
jgi:hypothetical protein